MKEPLGCGPVASVELKLSRPLARLCSKVKALPVVASGNERNSDCVLVQGIRV
jgi:hypothetical protein